MKLQSGNIDVTNMASGNVSNILDYVDRLDLNVVTVPVKITAADSTSNTMTIDSTSKSEAIAVIEELQDNNIFVILEAYPWINGGSTAETSWNPSTISTWFTNYKSVLSTLIDDIANEYDVWGFNVASNLELIEPNSSDWIDVFDYVRNTKSYSGKIIYRTNWWVTAVWDTGAGSTTEDYNNKLSNNLFSDDNLDIISISAYFELTEESTTEPSISTLESRLRSTTVTGTPREQDVYQEIKNFWTNHSKKIFFGEIGAPDKESASYHPWNPDVSSTDSQIAQSNLLQAYKNLFKDEYWFVGASNFVIGTDSSNYSVKNKIAEETFAYFMQPEKKKIIDTGRYKEVERVFVEDADGIFVNISDLENYDFVKNVTFDFDIDEDVIQANITVNRNIYKLNLSPFVSQSKLNVDGSGNFKPAINLNRKVYVETAIVPMDIEPSDSDYEEVFRGIIQDIDFQNENGIKLIVDDLGSRIRDKFIESETTYGVITSLSSSVSSGASSVDVKDSTGLSADNIVLLGDNNGYEQITISSVSGNTLNLSSNLSNAYEKGAQVNKLIVLETAIQDLLDDNLGAGEVTLYIPESPASYIKSFKQSKESLMFAIKNQVMQIGWKVSYRWDASTDSFRFTLYEPERNNVIPEHTFNKDEYGEPQRLSISKSSIRNVVSVLYPDPDNPEKDKTLSPLPKDQDSIDEYGRLFMEFTEGATSQINNETEANNLANYALSDLKQPKANLSIPIDYYPYVQLTELCRFKANPEYFDTDQDLAIIGYQHDITKGETILTCRGNPSGYYYEWLKREAKAGIAPASKDPGVLENVTTETGILDIAQTVSSYIDISWDTPNANVSFYQIRYRKQNDDSWNYLSTKNNYIKISPLAINTTYEIQVKYIILEGGSYNLSFDSGWTAIITQATPTSSNAPAAPTNLAGTFAGLNAIFTWDKPTEDDYYVSRVEVWINSTKVRTEYTSENQYVYTFEKNIEDNTNPSNSVTLNVYHGNTTDQYSSAASTSVTNSAPSTPTGFTMTSSLSQIHMDVNSTDISDFDKVEFEVATQSDYSDAEVVYSGSTFSGINTPTRTDGTNYGRVRFFDKFEQASDYAVDNTDANLIDESDMQGEVFQIQPSSDPTKSNLNQLWDMDTSTGITFSTSFTITFKYPQEWFFDMVRFNVDTASVGFTVEAKDNSGTWNTVISSGSTASGWNVVKFDNGDMVSSRELRINFDAGLTINELKFWTITLADEILAQTLTLTDSMKIENSDGSVFMDSDKIKAIDADGDYSILDSDHLSFYKAGLSTPHWYSKRVAYSDPNNPAEDGESIDLTDANGNGWDEPPKVITAISNLMSYNSSYSGSNQIYESYADAITRDGFNVYGHTIIESNPTQHNVGVSLSTKPNESWTSNNSDNNNVTKLSVYLDPGTIGDTADHRTYGYYSNDGGSTWTSWFSYTFESVTDDRVFTVSGLPEDTYKIKIERSGDEYSTCEVVWWKEYADTVVDNGQVMWIAIEGGAN